MKNGKCAVKLTGEFFITAYNPSVSFADSSLYTREPPLRRELKLLSKKHL